jgi:signal transduction histidine kinase
MADEMLKRSWQLISLALGAQVFFLLAAGVLFYYRIGQAHGQITALQRSGAAVGVVVNGVTESVFDLAVSLRDDLLDDDPGRLKLSLGQVSAIRLESRNHLDLLIRLTPAGMDPRIEAFRKELDGYLDLAEDLVLQTPQQRRLHGVQFIRTHLVPRKEALLQSLKEIEHYHEDVIRRRSAEVLDSQQKLRLEVVRTTTVAMMLGLVVAVLPVLRLRYLERQAGEHEGALRRNREELRRLSQELVVAQEEERRSLSRELHDQVGQTLTALRMEVGNLGSLRKASDEEFAEHWQSAKYLGDQALQTIRDISMGLRPSMLDDLGLEPAVRWQARDFARRTGIEASVVLEGDLSRLPERHRTYAYRIIQEALTNCARHSGASSVRITIHGAPDSLSVTVQDDGAGFDMADAPTRGVGLIGIQERAGELGGSVAIHSQPGRGAMIQVSLPIQEGVIHEQSPHHAGG